MLIPLLIFCLAISSVNAFAFESNKDIQALFRVSPPKEWAINDTFISLDNERAIDLKAAKPLLNDTTNYYNSPFIYKGIKTSSDWHGNELIQLHFTHDGDDFYFNTKKTLENFNDTTYQPVIAGLYPLKEIRLAQQILIGKTVYLKTTEYLSTDPNKKIKTKRYIPVTITDIQTDSIDRPVKVIFIDKNRDEYSLSTRLSNTLQPQSKVNFLYHFTEEDPKKKYPQINDETWETIQSGLIKPQMTQEEVILSVGKPNNRDRIPTYSGMREIWTYNHGIIITFHDGRVIDFRK